MIIEEVIGSSGVARTISRVRDNYLNMHMCGLTLGNDFDGASASVVCLLPR